MNTPTYHSNAEENFNPLDEPELMPLDRVGFDTNLLVDPTVITEANSEHIKNVRLPKDDPTGKYRTERTLLVELHGGVRLRISDCGVKGYWLRRVELNVGKLTNHHNGGLPSTPQVVTAFAVVCQKIEPLLADPGDAVLLIPGGHKGSPSYWSSVEIDMHLHDPDETLLSSLRNVRHPGVRKKATVYDGESITLGNRRGGLMISFYRKDLEMASDLEEFGVKDAAQILRVEVTLRKDALLRYLGLPGNTAMVSSVYSRGTGVPQARLVRFEAADIMAAHKKITGELKGISKVVAKGDLPTNERPGRMLGLVARHTGTPVEELLELYRIRFVPASCTMTRMRAAALDEISLNPGPAAELFTEDRYNNQPVISIPQLEQSGYPDDYPSKYRPLIEAAYGTRPAFTHESEAA